MMKLIRLVKPINLMMLTCLVSISLTLTFFYVSQEKYYYYWDYSRSSQQINELISSFQNSPFDAVGLFLISLFDDYTQIPSILILPLRIAFGETRIGFIYCLVLAYVVPFCLAIGAVVSKLFKSKSRLVFWSSSLFSLLFPSIWISAFRGFPDIGGASLTALAILTYWQDTSLKRANQRFQIALILGLSVLFRRHFIYSVRAFIVTIIIYKIIELFPLFLKRSSSFIKYLKIFSFRVIYVVILFSIFAFIVIVKALLINYRALYASYEASVLDNINYYADAFGLLFCIFSLLGFFLAFRSPLVDTNKLKFIFLFGIISAFQWILFARQINVQYVNHFLLFLIIGNYVLLWILYVNFRVILKIFLASISVLFYGASALASMFSCFKVNDFPSGILPKEELPLYREDFEQVKSLVEFLRLRSDSKKKIYVAASSYTLNYSVFTVAEQQLFGKAILPISRNSNVDSRDFYPLAGLLQAHYVIVGSPYQSHIDPKEQTVVKVVVDAFRQKWAIAQDFALLPQTFQLEHGVTVRIYERIRPTALSTIFETLTKMRSQVSRIPGQEPFWLDLKSEQPTAIIQDPLLRMAQVLRLPIGNQMPGSLLFFGAIPKNVKVSGLYSISKCTNSYDPISLNISTLDKSRNVLFQNAKSYPNSQLAPFELQISGQNASFLQLDLRVDSSRKDLVTCRAELNLLKVSPQ